MDKRCRAALEVAGIFQQLPPDGRKIMLWMCRLYMERLAAPSARVDAEIEMIEAAIQNGTAYDLTPPLMTLQ